jgi:hypothetical protein
MTRITLDRTCPGWVREYTPCKAKIRKRAGGGQGQSTKGERVANVLVKVIQYYRAKHYDLLITTRQLDVTWSICELHELANLKDLYQRVKNGQLDPASWYMISSHASCRCWTGWTAHHPSFKYRSAISASPRWLSWHSSAILRQTGGSALPGRNSAC